MGAEAEWGVVAGETPSRWLGSEREGHRACCPRPPPIRWPPGVCSRFRGFRGGRGSLIAQAAVCVISSRIAPRLRGS
jgi:hypothetical protein